ncbi:OmpA family protein [Marinobacter sp. 71-i]|uniref:OmpA family protein n=1 Tax=Marinobacter iranensis TaxID=2962607 RepID=A0ABT5YAR2_9GAMM|nr:OmpA family protein [Marinobacter iranensis]MDF0750767.1 OmpA family protein [Marinobacter iranensis]
MKTHSVIGGLVLGSVLLTGCASAPQSPEGADLVRGKLNSLQADPVLANKAPAALKEAEMAVSLAEQPLSDSDDNLALGAHRVYVADRQVEIAMAKAVTRDAEDRRAQLAEERATSRLDARTLEADRARADADRIEGERAEALALSDAEAAELQQQIDDLKAEATERGLVLTLGDLLFEFDSAELRAGNTSNLNRLVNFLKQYPERNAAIEGHTDNIGNMEYNRELSQRRAESVRLYLVQQGIASNRLTATGLGHGQPLASNDSEAGRQSNRRVEIIIDNPPRVISSSEAIKSSQ